MWTGIRFRRHKKFSDRLKQSNNQTNKKQRIFSALDLMECVLENGEK